MLKSSLLDVFNCYRLYLWLKFSEHKNIYYVKMKSNRCYELLYTRISE
jgi:hypothetical protein